MKFDKAEVGVAVCYGCLHALFFLNSLHDFTFTN